MALSRTEKALINLYRKAESNKQREVFRILDENTVVCSSITEYFELISLLRDKTITNKKTGE